MGKINFHGEIPKEFYWFNPPNYSIKNSVLLFDTKPKTDFWQRTHYGFTRDDGHCLFKNVKKSFLVSVKTTFFPKNQYDQCGLMVRMDSENWIKTSVEYENSHLSRLGSVVTNMGYSDWATTDIESGVRTMWFRIQNNNYDFLIESSTDGERWDQLRIAHLHKAFDQLAIGIYACSPMDSSFTCRFEELIIGQSNWE